MIQCSNLISLIPQLTGAQLIGELPSSVRRVHTDSRNLSEGDLFVALRGERFDAHTFLSKVKQEGAGAAIAQYGLAEAGLSGVQVPDTRKALGELARLWRTHFELPLIAVTGSNGKTTVTQMIASILRAAVGFHAVLATQGNLNNDIGVPLTILRLDASHRLAVVELGMNHPGEIAGLAGIAQPTVTLINNAQREHQEFMGSVEAVAVENGTAIAALAENGTVVIPSDEMYSSLWCNVAGSRRILSFSDTDINADVRLGLCQADIGPITIWTPQGEIEVQLQTLGRHNVRNALAAAACACAAGVSLSAIADGLGAFVPVQGRSRLFHLTTGTEVSLDVVDDTYNANPDSVRAAIDMLNTMRGPRLLVLGDMGEVGIRALDVHVEVLDYAGSKNFEAVLCIGEHMTKAVTHMRGMKNIQAISNMDDLIARVRSHAEQGGSLLVKGSRFMRMERVIDALLSDRQTLDSFLESPRHVA